jgi:uncharacterized LabA/DUF88 family protein
MGTPVLRWCMHVVTATGILGSALPHPHRTTSKYSMIGRFVKGKVAVFIDAENLFYAQRTLGWRVSYKSLIAYIRRECGKNTKCFLYTGIDDLNQGQRKFLDMLDINEYIVRTKTIKKIRTPHGYKWKNNLDIELAMEMFILAPKYDTAILVSGDSDFAPPIRHIKEHGKRIIVLSTRGHISRELLELAKYVDMKKLRDEIAQETSINSKAANRRP